MKRILPLALVSILAACGGGAESDPSIKFSPMPSNQFTAEDSEYLQQIELINGSGNVQFSANNLPAWASIDVGSGLISGTPLSEEDAITFSGISIIAIDGDRKATSNDFSITVTAVNDPPIINTQTLSFNEYQTGYIADLDLFDEESSYEQLNLSVSSDNDFVDIQVDKQNKIKIDFVDPLKLNVDGFKFILIVDDGELTTRKTISVIVSESDKMNAEISYIGKTIENQKFTILFDQPIPVNEISYLITGSNCTDKIQVSLDDFDTCLPLEKIDDNSDFSKLEFNIPDLENKTEYKIKVTKTILSSFSNPLTDELIFEFNSTPGLMITEIGGTQYSDDMRWFEIFNSSRSAINLNQYAVRTGAIEAFSCKAGACEYDENHMFELDGLVIQPGQYAVIRGQDWGFEYDNAERITYISSYETGKAYYPFWTDLGYIELIRKSDNHSEDYVVFGDWDEFDEYLSHDVNAWFGSSYPAYLYGDEGIYTSSLIRKPSMLDTDTALDWENVSFNTPGGPNDISENCVDDLDLDGLPDCTEKEGATYAGISLYELGARVNQRDIFIEVDYMDSVDEGVTPREEALQKVVDAFAVQGIAVHFDVGDLYDQAPGINHAKFDLGGGNKVDFSLGVTFDSLLNDNRMNFYDTKRSNMDYSRLPICHYMLMAYSQGADGSAGSGGVAELNGNDLIITLGNWGLNSNDLASTNSLINFQSITIMHELGHNLGLMHGGDSDVNYKPNYLSVMNYLYALNGLPTIGDNEGDRYYFEYNIATGTNVCGEVLMTNPFYGDYENFKIDFSSSASGTMNESLVNEVDGLNRVGSGPVDFDCDGFTWTYVFDLDVNFSNTIEELTNYNDWKGIDLEFQKYYSGNVSGPARNLNIRPLDLQLQDDVIGDDMGEVMREIKPPKTFFDMIRAY